MTAAEIIRRLGGATEVSRALGIGRSAVSNWPRAGIPSKYWLRLARLAAAVSDCADITIDVLERHTVSHQKEAA